MIKVLILFMTVLSPLPAINTSTSPLLIGDSIGYCAAPYLNEHGIRVDAYPGRQFVTGIFRALIDKPGKTVIIELGTNGPIARQNIRSMMDALRNVPRIYFVTVKEPRSWETEVNKTLYWTRDTYKRVKLIPWHRYATAHPNLLSPDGIHPTIPTGSRAFANLITRTINVR